MKKYLAIALCVILALACMFGCGNETDKPEATKAPEATEAPANTDAQPTEAPTATDAQPTEAPAATEDAQATEAPAATEDAQATEAPAATEGAQATEAPKATEVPAKVEVMDVKGIVTDVSEIVPFEQFTHLGGCQVEYGDSEAYAIIYADGEEAAISLRGYDQRYIDEGTGLVSDDPVGERVLADTTAYPFFAVKVRVAKDAEMNSYGFKNTTWDTSIGGADSISYDDKPIECDGKWHVITFKIEEEMPFAWSAGQSGDPFDCFVIGAPLDGEELHLAWYGLFESEAEIAAWDANYTARFPKDMA